MNTQDHIKTESQEKQILHALRLGERLTSLQMLRRFGAMQAPARVFYLKRQGHNIAKCMVKTKTGKRVAQYFMERN